MADKEWTSSLSEEEKQNQTGSGSAEEAKKAPSQPLNDEALEGAAGGLSGGMQTQLPPIRESGVLI